MTEIRPRPDESPEAYIKRFQKQVQNDGILQEVRDRRHYEKPSVKKHKDKVALKIRLRQEQKKLDEIAAFENANKFRPRPKRNSGRPNKPYNKRNDSGDKANSKPAYKKVVSTEKVKTTSKAEITAEALTDLQNKFKKH